MGWARKTTSFSHFVFKPELLPVAGPIIPYNSEEKFQIKSFYFTGLKRPTFRPVSFYRPECRWPECRWPERRIP